RSFLGMTTVVIATRSLRDERLAGCIQRLELALRRRRAERQAEYAGEELRLRDCAEVAARVEAAAETRHERRQFTASDCAAQRTEALLIEPCEGRGWCSRRRTLETGRGTRQRKRESQAAEEQAI